MSFEEWTEKTKFSKITYNYSSQPTWHMLYEASSKRPASVCRYLTTINELLPYYTGVSPWYNIQSLKNRRGELKVPANFNTRISWMVEYNPVTEVFEQPKSKLQFHDAYRYAVLQEKAGTIDYINEKIEKQRLTFEQDLFGQSKIENIKNQEAREILELHNSGSAIDSEKFPMLGSYSQIVSCDILTIANEISIKNSYINDVLTQTEQLRMKYVQATIKCKELIEVKAVLQNFIDETRTWPVI